MSNPSIEGFGGGESQTRNVGACNLLDSLFLVLLRPGIQTSNFKPQTPNPKPQTPNPKPQTPNPKPQTPNPKPQDQHFGIKHSFLASTQRSTSRTERELFIDNLLVRIPFIIVMIRWTGLAPWEFESPFPGSLTSTFLPQDQHFGIEHSFLASTQRSTSPPAGGEVKVYEPGREAPSATTRERSSAPPFSTTVVAPQGVTGPRSQSVLSWEVPTPYTLHPTPNTLHLTPYACLCPQGVRARRGGYGARACSAGRRDPEPRNPKLETRNPKPETETRNPKPETRNRNQKPETKPKTRNPRP